MSCENQGLLKPSTKECLVASTRRKWNKPSPIPSDTDTGKAFSAEVCCENCFNDHSRSLASQRWALGPHCIIITRFHVSFAFRLLFTGFLHIFFVFSGSALEDAAFRCFWFGVFHSTGEGLVWKWFCFYYLLCCIRMVVVLGFMKHWGLVWQIYT